jgi:hypothetical protein
MQTIVKIRRTATLVAALAALGLVSLAAAPQAQARGGRGGDGVLPLSITEDAGAETAATDAAASQQANDGVLPLRLPNDGVLPLRLTGDALTLLTPPGGIPVPRLAMDVVITRAGRAAMTPVQAALLTCQSLGLRVSKHEAAGTVAIGAGLYTIKGICYDPDTRNMEIVAERRVGQQSVERSVTVAVLGSEEPVTLNGRLNIEGGSQAGRFMFDVARPAPPPTTPASTDQ